MSKLEHIKSRNQISININELPNSPFELLQGDTLSHTVNQFPIFHHYLTASPCNNTVLSGTTQGTYRLN